MQETVRVTLGEVREYLLVLFLPHLRFAGFEKWR